MTHMSGQRMTGLELNAGAEKLRDSLAAMGLKSGGTPQQRAERLMQTKGVSLATLPKKLFARGAAPSVSPPAHSQGHIHLILALPALSALRGPAESLSGDIWFPRLGYMHHLVLALKFRLMYPRSVMDAGAW